MKIMLCLSLLALVGCSHYTHVRVTPDGARESTSFLAFGQKSAANKISSLTTMQGTNYSRDLKVGAISSEVSDQLAPLFQALYTAGMEAGKKAVAP